MGRSRRSPEYVEEVAVESEYDTKKIWIYTAIAIFVYAAAIGSWLFLREKGEPLRESAPEVSSNERGATEMENSEVASTSVSGDDGVSSRSGDVDIWNCVPKDAHGVGFLDVKKLARSGMLEKVLEMTRGNQKEGQPSVDEVLSKLGLNPEKDIEGLVMVFQEGKSGSDGEKEQGGVIVSGRFDAESIMDYAMEENPGSSRMDLGGIPALKMKVAADSAKGLGGGGSAANQEDALLAVADGKVLFGGTEAFVRSATDLYRGQGVAFDKSRSPIVSKARRFSKRTLWVSSKVPPKEEKEEEANGASMKIGPDMSVIKHVVMGADFEDGGFGVEARMECGTSEEAGSLQVEMQSGVMMLSGMVGMFAQGDPNASKLAMEVVQGIKFGSESKEATVSFELTGDLISKIEKTVKKVAAKQGQGMGGMPGASGGENPF